MTNLGLRAIGWDHLRCMSPMYACADEWSRTGHGELHWDVRSLEAFGDESLEEIASSYDLLVIDHPFCGAAARSGCLLALDELLDHEALAALQAAAIGPTQSSYEYQGHTWALACDAACQVSAFDRNQVIAPLPSCWPDAVDLVRSLGRRAALPLSPAHAISSLLTLWAGAGLDPVSGGVLVDPDAGLEPLDWLVHMHGCGNPAATGWEPPQALNELAAGRLAYVPLTYGYASYSLPLNSASHCRFTDIPGISGAVLGGAGLAVSSTSSNPCEAAAFAAWACGSYAQRQFVAPNGGQPANADCWDDASLNVEAGGFYSGTRATIEAAWVRPREAWWPRFQLEGGRALTAGLEDRVPARRLLERLVVIHHEITQMSQR